MSASTETLQETPGRQGAYGAIVLVAVALGWAYARTIADLIKEWTADPNYSVGMIVPFAAAYVVWLDRERLARVKIGPAWSGAAILIFAQIVRMLGLALLYESAERYSLLLSIFGLVVLVGGWKLSRALAPALLLLVLMIPLPASVHNFISSPLQDLSTNGAVATLELLGITVSQKGHVLMLNDQVPVAVAEACSGLRMLTAFIFVSAVFACVIQRPRWQKIVLLISSIPIAILSNLIRLVATALLFLWTSDEIANRFSHDVAGWAMMPVAVALLMGELWILSYLVVEDKPSEPV